MNQPTLTVPAEHQTTPALDPAWVLWNAFGQPIGEWPMTREGRCSRCNSHTSRASRIKQVVSDKFTGWDDYTHDPDPLWCEACTWAHTEPDLRTRAWHIGPNGSLEATRALLGELLTAPLPSDVALSVPLSRKKHILPSATWGHITTDDRLLAWGTTEVGRINDLRWLRDLGFNEAALTERAPRFEQLAKVNPGLMDLVLRRWQNLTPWRTDDTYLRVALLAIRPEKKGK